MGWCNSLGSLRGKRGRIAALILVAYLGLILQPCAMAMGQDPVQHPTSCHDVVSDGDDLLCFSQSSAECAIDDWDVDTRDSRASDLDPPSTPIILTDPTDPGADSLTATYYPLQAPPPGEPALHIRHCVFLK